MTTLVQVRAVILGPVTHVSPNFGYPRGTHGQCDPEVIVWHITASAPTDPPLDGLDGWFRNPVAGSAQLGIQDGTIHKYVELNDAAWHAGLMRSPDLGNRIIAQWWNENINPNIRGIGVEVVSQAGPNQVSIGHHRVNEETWETMAMAGLVLQERFPAIKMNIIYWVGHGQIDSISRGRDPFTIYLPYDVMRRSIALSIPPQEEEEDMVPLYPVKLVTQESWAVDGHGFVARLNNPDDIREMKRVGLLAETNSAVVDRETMKGLGVPEDQLPRP